MGSIRGPDKYQAISISGSTLSMTASASVPIKATVGGKQYYITASISSTLSGLTAGTTYFVYLVPSAGTLIFSVSASAPSAFTNSAGFVLVGGIIADSSSTGLAITDIYGPPVTDTKANVPTLLNAWTNSTLTGSLRRNGEKAEIGYKLQTTGTPTGSALSFYMPTGLVLDNTKLSSNGDGMCVGQGGIYQQGILDGSLLAFVNNNGGNAYFNATYLASVANSGIASVTPTSPVAITNHPDFIWLDVIVPVVGWSSIPLINQ